MLLHSLAIALVAAATLGSAEAQTMPAPDIVVTGNKETDRRAAEAYVSSIAVRSESQLARFHQPVCPLVIGMPKPYSTMVEKRVAADAAAAGIDVAKKLRCDANLIIVIADDGAALVKDIRIHYSGWLAGLSPRDIDALTVPGPARAWSVTSLRNEDGQGLRNQPDSPAGDGLAGKPVLRVMTASILRQPTRQDMEASFVMIDKAATMGLTLRQVADYAAMRGLARTRPPAAGEKGLATILTIFESAQLSRVPELTNADAAYLRALYRGDGTAAAVNEKNDIARRIAKGNRPKTPSKPHSIASRSPLIPKGVHRVISVTWSVDNRIAGIGIAPMESDIRFYARRVAQERIAAKNAVTAEARARRLELAEKFQEKLAQLEAC